MLYIIKSDSYRLLKDKIEYILKDEEKDNITNYDLSIDSLKDIIYESNNNSLFSSNNISIVNNCNIFGTSHEYKEDLALLEDYLNIKSKIIFIVENYSLKKSIVKRIKDMGNLFDLSSPIKDELNTKVKEYLNTNGYKINTNALIEIINRCNNNYDIILNELDKVLIVKNDKLITKEDIVKYTNSYDNIDIFDIVDKVVKKKVNILLKDLNLIINNIETQVLLSNIASQYRLIYSVKNLIKEGLSEKQISEELSLHPYRIKLAHENSFIYTNEELIEKLLFIGELDKKIKTGEIDKNNAIKLLLINI